ncbi:alpha/beta hydrolase [Nocardia sp. CA2R105]|uniref:alpha/beta hydrolase fold domain-containing protein n=1 Tax=Nocardia coffeae TaxID=2873381 RepID=UPI001CA7B286|nr:alpha/beta hydrolase [Nocardia coffeae]MBY8861962.1 alpha/beta hydrolase [Nocardia coffeae]
MTTNPMLSKFSSFRLRKLPGVALYYAIKLAPIDLGDPAFFARMLEKDRAAGPKRPSRRALAKLDFREGVEEGLRTFRARRKGAPETPLRLLFLHGGACIMDLQTIQWNIPIGLLERVDAEVVAPIYPLGPEADWQETTTAIKQHYLALAEAHGAENIIVFGDSAGASLTLLLAQALRDGGLPQPKALLLFSPALDLTGTDPGQIALARRDPMLSLNLLKEVEHRWLKGLPPDDPRVSALFASHADLPPTMIFSGDREFVHSDALRLKAVNPSVDHRPYPGMVHVWPNFSIPEARQALDEAASFIRLHSRA